MTPAQARTVERRRHIRAALKVISLAGAVGGIVTGAWSYWTYTVDGSER